MPHAHELDATVRRLLDLSSPIDRLHFVFVSDLHIHMDEPYPEGTQVRYPSTLETRERLRAFVDEVNAMDPAPAFVLFGGDLTDYGQVGEWHCFFDELERLRVPAHLQLGNHDHTIGRLEDFLQVARERAPEHATRSEVAGVYAYGFEAGGYRFAVLDTKSHGELDGGQRALVTRTLAEPGRGAMLAVHRPLTTVGNWVDEHLLRDRDLLDELVESDTLLCVLSGHVHQARAWRYRGARHLINPALAYGIGDDLGYRIVGLADGAVAWSLVRYLHGPTLAMGERWYSDAPGSPYRQAGRVAIDNPESFEDHPLCHPFRWPYEPDPRKRLDVERQVPARTAGAAVVR